MLPEMEADQRQRNKVGRACLDMGSFGARWPNAIRYLAATTAQYCRCKLQRAHDHQLVTRFGWAGSVKRLKSLLAADDRGDNRLLANRLIWLNMTIDAAISIKFLDTYPESKMRLA
jgi:hypothetical protein